MPQLELIPWFFNFILAWGFLLMVATITINSTFPCTNYITVTSPLELNHANNWLWT